MADAFSDQALGETEVFTGFPPSGSTLCPRCDYELTGLPIVGTCPECGLLYDADSKVWEKCQQMDFFPIREIAKKTLIKTVLFVSMYHIPRYFDPQFARLFGQPTFDQMFFNSAILLPLMFGFESATWYFDNRSYRTVLAVMPEVLIQSRWFGGRAEIPMHCVIKAQESSLIDTVKSISVFYRPAKTRGRVRVRGISIPAGDQAERDAFMKAINRHPKVQRS